MSDYTPNPANYTMKRNPPKREVNQPLIEVDAANTEAVRSMVWDKLVAIAATLPATAQALPVLREIMDRLEGKPMQRIKQDTTVSFDLKANSALLNRFKDRLGVKDTIVIEQTTSGNES